MTNYTAYRNILVSVYGDRIGQLMLADMVDENGDEKVLQEVARDLYYEYQDTMERLNSLLDQIVESRKERRKRISDHYLYNQKRIRTLLPSQGVDVTIGVMNKHRKKSNAVRRNIAAVSRRMYYFHGIWLMKLIGLRSLVYCPQSDPPR